MLQCLITSITFLSLADQVGNTLTQPVLAACLICHRNFPLLAIIPGICEATKYIFRGYCWLIVDGLILL